jgi:hypothetical protein
MRHSKFAKELTAEMLLNIAKDELPIMKELNEESPSKGYWYINHQALLLDHALLALVAYSKNKINLNKKELESLFKYGIPVSSLKERSRLIKEFQKLHRKGNK